MGVSLLVGLLTLSLLLPFALCPPCLTRSLLPRGSARTLLSLPIFLLPSLPPPSPPLSPLLNFSIRHRAFYSGRVGGRIGRNRGRVSGPPHSGDVPGSFSLVSRSALVDLGIVGHSGPLVSDVPSERGAEGGVAKRQASAAGPRPESSPSLLLYSSKRKRTHTCSSPLLTPSFPPSPPSFPPTLSFDHTPRICSTRLHALIMSERDKVKGASIGGSWEGVGGSMPVAGAASAHTFPSFPRAVGFSAGATCLPLSSTYLVGVPTNYINPILAFNQAVWKYRKPALAARNEQTALWLSNRIVELAHSNLRACRPKPKERKHSDLEFFIKEHYNTIESAHQDTIFAFTDGSAIPNPGPCGSGVFIIAPEFNLNIVAGAYCGKGTNNLGELLALAICFQELIDLFRVKAFKHTFIFSDSNYAIGAAASLRRPWSNGPAVNIVRRLMRVAVSLFSVRLLWIKAHAGIPGNEAADQIAKRFSTSTNISVPSDVSTLPYHRCQFVWPFGPPLSSLPLHIFSPPSLPSSPNSSLSLPSDPDVPARFPKTPHLATSTKATPTRSPLSVRRSTRLAATFVHRVADDLVANSLIEPLDFKHCD